MILGKKVYIFKDRKKTTKKFFFSCNQLFDECCPLHFVQICNNKQIFVIDDIKSQHGVMFYINHPSTHVKIRLREKWNIMQIFQNRIKTIHLFIENPVDTRKTRVIFVKDHSYACKQS